MNAIHTRVLFADGGLMTVDVIDCGGLGCEVKVHEMDICGDSIDSYSYRSAQPMHLAHDKRVALIEQIGSVVKVQVAQVGRCDGVPSEYEVAA